MFGSYVVLAGGAWKVPSSSWCVWKVLFYLVEWKVPRSIRIVWKVPSSSSWYVEGS